MSSVQRPLVQFPIPKTETSQADTTSPPAPTESPSALLSGFQACDSVCVCVYYVCVYQLKIQGRSSYFIKITVIKLRDKQHRFIWGYSEQAHIKRINN